MPIYEYECASCGHRLEALQKVSEDPLKECPECHKNALGKLVSATSFQLKGTGWYETDFKTKSKPTADVKAETSKTEAPKTATDTSSKGTTSE